MFVRECMYECARMHKKTSSTYMYISPHLVPTYVLPTSHIIYAHKPTQKHTTLEKTHQISFMNCLKMFVFLIDVLAAYKFSHLPCLSKLFINAFSFFIVYLVFRDFNILSIMYVFLSALFLLSSLEFLSINYSFFWILLLCAGFLLITATINL